MIVSTTLSDLNTVGMVRRCGEVSCTVSVPATWTECVWVTVTTCWLSANRVSVVRRWSNANWVRVGTV